MTKEQRSIASAYVISALVGGVYLISWLTHVWGDQPWPIKSNMVNYAVVLVLFGVSLLLFGNLFARILPQERGIVRACDARLQGRGAAAALVASALVTAAYLIYYANIGVSKEFAGPTAVQSSLTTPQLVPLYYLLTVLFFAAAVYLLLTGKDCPQWMTWGGYGLSAVMYFLGVWIVNTFEGDPYHGEAYLESIYNVADGIPYEELTTGIYGHYGLFFLLPMKIFGAKAVVIQFLIALVGVVTDLAMLYCIHHLIKKNWVRLLMALVVPVIPFAYRRTNYWQLQPHRLVFPMLLAAYMLFCLRKKQSKKTARFWGGWLLCMLAVLWSTESGLFCIIGWCAGCIVRWWQQEPWYARGQWERYGALLLGAVLAVLGAIGLTNLYNLACGGAPIFKVFFYPLYSSNYMDGSIGYPLELGVRPWVFMLLLMLAVLAWSLFQTTAIGRIAKTENIAPFAACLSVLGLVSFSYYANRSAWMNLEICLPEALLCLCFPLQALTDGEGLRKKLGGLYCTAAQSVGLAVLLVLCVLTAQLPGGVMNTAILQEHGAFSTRGIYAEVENFSANIPDNTFAVGRDVGIIYHAAGWDNYGHYVDAADYGVADTEKLLPHILAELKSQPSFVVDDILGVYLGQNGYTPDMLGYQLQTTFTSAGGVKPTTYYYYEKQ